MYTNETTAVINIVNLKTRSLEHPEGHEHPYVLRVPNEELRGTSAIDYLVSLNGSRDLAGLLKECVTSLSDYYFGELRMYVIQEDRTYSLKVPDILEDIPDSVRDTVENDVRGALEACAGRFNMELPRDTAEAVAALSAKGMTPYTVTLFVQNHLLDTYSSPEEKAYIAAILKGKA